MGEIGGMESESGARILDMWLLSFGGGGGGLESLFLLLNLKAFPKDEIRVNFPPLVLTEEGELLLAISLDDRCYSLLHRPIVVCTNKILQNGAQAFKAYKFGYKQE